jgi:hypothetical protein
MNNHWTVYGQTRLDPAIPHHHNPDPMTGLVIGEVDCLPYTVPAGKILLINRVTLEAHWGTVLWPWIGAGNPAQVFTWDKVIETFRGYELEDAGPTYEWHPEIYLPAGSVLNITLHPRKAKSNMRQGWGLSGKLLDCELSVAGE